MERNKLSVHNRLHALCLIPKFSLDATVAIIITNVTTNGSRAGFVNTIFILCYNKYTKPYHTVVRAQSIGMDRRYFFHFCIVPAFLCTNYVEGKLTVVWIKAEEVRTLV